MAPARANKMRRSAGRPAALVNIQLNVQSLESKRTLCASVAL